CMLCSNNPSEAYYMAMVTHLSSIKSSLPFIHFFDGFRTSHEISKINMIDMDNVKDLIDKKSLSGFRERAMHTNNPNTRGTAQNEDVYFQNMEVRNSMYDDVPGIVSKYMDKVNKLTGNNIHIMDYYGSDKATDVIVAMGSVCDTIKDTIDYLNSKDNKYGLVSVHLYRPFDGEYLSKILPKSVKNIAVLDRTKEAGSQGEPLYLDVVASLNNTSINIIGGRYGLSSKNTTPGMIKGVYEFMSSKYSHHNFTVGIEDDVTNLSIKYDKEFKLPSNDTEFLIYGYGSDGMVSTSKDIIKIIGDYTKNYVQGYFQYDSKKSGGVTRSHIRISDNPIRAHYYVDNPSLVVVSKDTYIYKYDMLSNMKDKSTLILNTSLDDDKLLKSLPNKVKYQLASKNIKLYVIDAYKLVNELGLKNKISTCMEVCIFSIIKVLNNKKVNSIMKETNEKRFSHKGKKIVDINNKVVDNALSALREVKIDKNWLNLVYIDKQNRSFLETINDLDGESLPVSAFLDKYNGVFPSGTAREDKRDIAENVPCWISENCIECNQCAFVCPHAVIRPFLLDNDTEYEDTIDSIMPKDKKFAIGVSYKDCTGCGLCANVCPGKAGKKALEMKKYDRDEFKQDKFDYLLKNNVNDSFKPPIMNVRNESFKMPKFEFSGACAGCGETAYIKNLTQMFGDNMLIANATGCSSIYGGSCPSMPYSIPWASSLFEDNSEYGLGILTGININRDKVKSYMTDNLSKD
ncbi:MAG: 2-oxoacid:acceptor oxidoreductase family protein, partial [Bacilli bacterium]|nr:2-oxoacid:acceptor oxidoreductase family protein [Bacilli bacterium]